jgi:hypothetical protein
MAPSFQPVTGVRRGLARSGWAPNVPFLELRCCHTRYSLFSTGGASSVVVMLMMMSAEKMPSGITPRATGARDDEACLDDALAAQYARPGYAHDRGVASRADSARASSGVVDLVS